MSYVETRQYSRLDVMVGESAELSCNTSLTVDVKWTYENDKGLVDYVYLNGHIIKPRLSTKPTANGFHSLVIADTEAKDSGLYDCYDGKNSRKVGYQLVVAGM